MAITRNLRVTITGETSKLNESLYVYQHDRGIDVTFSLVEQKFDFTGFATNNMLESEEIMYAGITVKKPSGEGFFRPMLPIIENQVVWRIEHEHTDEFDEIGKYSLHVHLYDKFDNRVSIPPFEMEVKKLNVDGVDEILAKENTSTIDQAVVGISPIAGDSVFFIIEDGYIATDWKKGDIITATLMNKIELALQDTVAKLNSLELQHGIDGVDGKSAYEIAVETGFSGTIEEWLESLQGKQGEQGEKGEQGEQGIQGIQGDKGEQGIQGEQGVPGEKGDKGEQGIQGIQGIQGEKGEKGEQGIQGIPGEKGEKGETGATGATGAKGEQGIQGIPGEKGETGATGAKGEQGIQGVPGEKGETGATGATGANGKDGVDGKSVELQKNTTHVQWRKEGETWKDLIALEELKGDKGDAGDSSSSDLTNYYTKEEVEAKITEALDSVDLSDYVTKEYLDAFMLEFEIPLHEHNEYKSINGLVTDDEKVLAFSATKETIESLRPTPKHYCIGFLRDGNEALLYGIFNTSFPTATSGSSYYALQCNGEEPVFYEKINNTWTKGEFLQNETGRVRMQNDIRKDIIFSENHVVGSIRQTPYATSSVNSCNLALEPGEYRVVATTTSVGASVGTTLKPPFSGYLNVEEIGNGALRQELKVDTQSYLRTVTRKLNTSGTTEEIAFSTWIPTTIDEKEMNEIRETISDMEVIAKTAISYVGKIAPSGKQIPAPAIFSAFDNSLIPEDTINTVKFRRYKSGNTDNVGYVIAFYKKFPAKGVFRDILTNGRQYITFVDGLASTEYVAYETNKTNDGWLATPISISGRHDFKYHITYPMQVFEHDFDILEAKNGIVTSNIFRQSTQSEDTAIGDFDTAVAPGRYKVKYSATDTILNAPVSECDGFLDVFDDRQILTGSGLTCSRTIGGKWVIGYSQNTNNTSRGHIGGSGFLNQELFKDAPKLPYHDAVETTIKFGCKTSKDGRPYIFIVYSSQDVFPEDGTLLEDKVTHHAIGMGEYTSTANPQSCPYLRTSKELGTLTRGFEGIVESDGTVTWSQNNLGYIYIPGEFVNDIEILESPIDLWWVDSSNKPKYKLFDKQTSSSNINNFDYAKLTGSYTVALNSESKADNSPFDFTEGVLQVQNIKDVIVQEYIENGNKRKAYRTCQNNTWSAWSIEGESGILTSSTSTVPSHFESAPIPSKKVYCTIKGTYNKKDRILYVAYREDLYRYPEILYVEGRTYFDVRPALGSSFNFVGIYEYDASKKTWSSVSSSSGSATMDGIYSTDKDIVYKGEVAFKAQSGEIQNSESDFDKATKFEYYEVTGANLANSPIDADLELNGHLTNIFLGADIQQTYNDLNTGIKYKRMYTGKTWSKWSIETDSVSRKETVSIINSIIGILEGGF